MYFGPLNEEGIPPAERIRSSGADDRMCPHWKSPELYAMAIGTRVVRTAFRLSVQGMQRIDLRKCFENVLDEGRRSSVDQVSYRGAMTAISRIVLLQRPWLQKQKGL